ncbi:Trk system potassium uptake protein TrkG [Symmachiella dynata]|uniref:Trk system potassium uptake protein TrkG n=1 Tax=Symmachiella dynata TaxID=2527995 RepID=A0A517ZWF2_9PLAN|nr:TrkH family potassium uptake protein [Symmachiella dynata]QDU46794.1 Trk system potassium uptake protein TrkG [Symmachiella dynata]
MNWLLLCRMLGLLAMLVGGSMVFSLPWAFPEFGQTTEFEYRGFWGLISAIAVSLGVGGTLSFLGRKEHGTILRKEALAIVGLGWILAGLLGALPYLFSGTMRDAETPMSIPDAVFESVSGFTTTGASVLTELEDPAEIPRCIMFWRCFTNWLGGMGIIVLFVAILGQLGAAGKALMRREVPGPISESVRPRVREQAIVMWVIYVVLSAILVGILQLEGMSGVQKMDIYNSLCHTFATMATGGFSTLNGSVGGFNSPLIEYTIIVFMIAAGTNFTLFYLVTLHRRNPLYGEGWWGRFKPLFSDVEFRAYLTIIFVATIILTMDLLWIEHYQSVLDAFRNASFQVVSIMTTTGFGTDDFDRWSEFSKGLLLLLMFVGGCAGSTGGGLKVIRFVLFAKIMRLEIEQAFRPNVVRPLRIAGVTLDNSLRHDVLVYFCLILTIYIGSWMLLAAIETDDQWRDTTLTVEEMADEHRPHRAEKLLDCASAVAATLNNIGPGVGVVGPTENYAAFSGAGKLLLTVCMLLGRLELFAILVLFVPSFWKSH